MTKLSIEPTGAGLGAVVRGVDLKQLGEREFSQIANAFAEAEVLFIRDQQLEPQDHLQFAQRFASVNVNRFFTPVAGHPQVAEERKEPDQQVNIGGGWHTDHSYDIEPALGSMAYAKVLPKRGGDTLFASMTKAFAALSPGLQQSLRGLRAVHSARHVFGNKAERPAELSDRLGNSEAAALDATHPVVIEHPLSGKPALYVNPGFTRRFEGWTEAESKPLLDYLYQFAARPEFCYRHQWRQGTLAFWDNRATWHYAQNDYPGQRRVMHRITLAGCALQASA